MGYKGDSRVTIYQPLSAGNYSICHLHEENNTLHEYLIINSFEEVAGFMKEIIYEEQ